MTATYVPGVTWSPGGQVTFFLGPWTTRDPASLVTDPAEALGGGLHSAQHAERGGGEEVPEVGEPLWRSRGAQRHQPDVPGFQGWFCVAVTSLASYNPSDPSPQPSCSSEIPKA